MGSKTDLSLGVGATLIGGTQQAFSAIANGFQVVAEGMRLGATALKKLGEAKGDKGILAAARGVTNLSTKLEKNSAELASWVSGLSKADAASAKTAVSIDKQTKALKEGEISLAEMVATAAKRNEQRKQDAKAGTKAAAAANKEAGAIAGLESNMAMLVRRYTDLFNSTGSFHTATKNLISTLTKEGASLASVKYNLTRLNKGFKAANEVTNKTAAVYAKLRASFPEFVKQSKALRKTTLTYEEQIAVLKRLRKARQAAEAVANKAANVKRAQMIALLDTKYKMLISSTDKYGRRAKQVQAVLKRHPEFVDRATKSYERLMLAQKRSFNIMTPLNQAVTRLGRSFKTYMSYMAASSVIFAVITSFRTAKQTIVDFDQSLRDLQAITQSTMGQMNLMGEAAKQYASDTKFSAIEVTQGMKLLGQSGLNAIETIETIGAVSDLATGTLSEMSTTVDLVTTAMRVFGVESKDSAVIADVFANAVNRSKLTIDKIRIAMNYIGPVAHAAGVGLKEVTSAMMILANQGIRASTIGTGLRQVIRRLVAPNRLMVNALGDASLILDDLNPQMRSFAEVIDNLALVVTDARTAFEMFGQRGATAVLALTQSGSVGLNNMLAIVKRTGTAAGMAATQMEGLGVSYKNLSDKIRNLYLQMGDNGLAGVFRVFVDVARGLVDILNFALGSALIKTVGTAGTLLIAIQGLNLALKLLAGTKVIGAVRASFRAASVAMASYTVTTTTSATATTLLERSITRLSGAYAGLRALIGGLGPGGIIVALSAVAIWFANIDDKIADANRTFAALSQQILLNIDALSAYQARLKTITLTEEESAEVVANLARLYPKWAEEIEATKGNTEELTGVVQDLIDAQRDLMTQNALKGFSNALQAISHESGVLKRTGGVFGFLQGFFADMPTKALKSEKAIQHWSGVAADYLMQLKQMNPQATLEELFDMAPFIQKLTLEASGFKAAIATAFMRKDAEVTAIAEKYGIDLAESARRAASQVAVLSPDAIKSDYKKRIAEQTRDIKKFATVQEALRARGLQDAKTTTQNIRDFTIQAYENMLDAAREYTKRAADRRDAALMVKGARAELDREAQLNQLLLKKLGTYNDAVDKADEKLARNKKRRIEEVAKYQNKITEKEGYKQTAEDAKSEAYARKLEQQRSSYANKKANLELSLAKKREELLREYVDAEREAQRDILGIRSDLQVKLLELQQTGKAGWRKERMAELAGDAALAKSKEVLAQGVADKNIELIDRSEELAKQAGDYYSSLQHSDKAIAGVKKVAEALEETRLKKGEWEEQEVSNKYTDEQQRVKNKLALYKKNQQEQLNIFISKQASKLKVAKDVIQARIDAEHKRHQRAMQNIEDEKAAIAGKKAEAVELRESIKLSAPVEKEMREARVQEQTAKNLPKPAAAIPEPTVAEKTAVAEQAKKTTDVVIEESVRAKTAVIAADAETTSAVILSNQKKTAVAKESFKTEAKAAAAAATVTKTTAVNANNIVVASQLNTKDKIVSILEGTMSTYETVEESFESTVGGLATRAVGGITDSLIAMTDHTKDAKQTFKDFGVDTLRWLQKIIVQQLVMNSLFGNNFNGTSSTLGGLFGWTAKLFHSGGMVGKPAQTRTVDPGLFAGARRLHTGGLAKNEVPVILKNDEGVFTKEQMKAMGGMTGASDIKMEVNVINESGTEVTGEAQEPRFDGERWVLDIILGAVGTNKQGFRNNLKGALG